MNNPFVDWRFNYVIWQKRSQFNFTQYPHLTLISNLLWNPGLCMWGSLIFCENHTTLKWMLDCGPATRWYLDSQSTLSCTLNFQLILRWDATRAEHAGMCTCCFSSYRWDVQWWTKERVNSSIGPTCGYQKCAERWALFPPLVLF